MGKKQIILQDYLSAKCSYLPTMIYSGLTLRAKGNCFSLVTSGPETETELYINLMIHQLRGAGPMITWYCKETREISLRYFSVALDSSR